MTKPSIVFAAALIACSGAPADDDGDAGDNNAGDNTLAGDTDAPVGDQASTGDTVAGLGDAELPLSCEGEVAWTVAAEPFPSPRDHHGTFVRTATGSAKLHVLGGYNGQALGDMWEADINSDGSLGPWLSTTSLPEAQSGSAIATQADQVFVIGGMRGGTMGFQMTASSFVSHTDARGAIDAWEVGPDLPVARFHANGAVAGGYIYVTGGLASTGDAQASVYRLSAAAPNAFDTLGDLPGPRSHHSSAVLDGYLYLFFGLEGNPFSGGDSPLTDIIRAQLLANGDLAAWEPAVNTQAPVATHASTVMGDCVYVVGGLRTNPLTYFSQTSVFSLEDGTPTFVRAAGDLNESRSHVHQAPAHNGRLYVVSGRYTVGEAQRVSVEIGTPPGEP